MARMIYTTAMVQLPCDKLRMYVRADIHTMYLVCRVGTLLYRPQSRYSTSIMDSPGTVSPCRALSRFSQFRDAPVSRHGVVESRDADCDRRGRWWGMMQGPIDVPLHVLRGWIDDSSLSRRCDPHRFGSSGGRTQAPACFAPPYSTPGTSKHAHAELARYSSGLWGCGYGRLAFLCARLAVVVLLP